MCPGLVPRRPSNLRQQVSRDSIDPLHGPGRTVQGTPLRLCTLTELNEEMAPEARMQAWFKVCETRTKLSSKPASRWSPPRPTTRAPDSCPGPSPTETLDVQHVERSGDVWTVHRFLCRQWGVKWPGIASGQSLRAWGNRGSSSSSHCLTERSQLAPFGRFRCRCSSAGECLCRSGRESPYRKLRSDTSRPHAPIHAP